MFCTAIGFKLGVKFLRFRLVLHIEDFITIERGLLGGIALDVAGGKMYWTDWGFSGIQCANLDGSNVQILVNTDDTPWDIALDAAGGKVYWTLAPISGDGLGVYQSRGRAAYWDGRNALGEPVASGVYFYTLTAGEFIATRRMLILK